MRYLTICLCLLSTQNALALVCNDGSYEVKVSLTDLGKNLDFCQIKHQGKLVKHGPEEVTDLDGKGLEKNFYRYGEKSSVPYNSVGLPGISQEHADFLAKNQAIDKKKVAAESVTILFKALLPFFSKTLNTSKFQVNGCSDYKKQWMQILVFKSAQNLSYQFNQKCHIAGQVSYSKEKDINVNLDLQKLDPFLHVNMSVKCSTSIKELPLVAVSCATLNGELIAQDKSRSLFKANYDVVINPQNKRFLEKNIGGKISFHKLFNKDESYTTPLYIKD